MKVFVSLAIFAIIALVSSQEAHSEKKIDIDLTTSVPRDIELKIENATSLGRVPISRIVGGSEVPAADRKLFKYQVGLHFDKKFWCGGSILSKRVIVTAAHCVHQMTTAVVFVGLYDKSMISTDNTQIFDITYKNWAQHEKYDDVKLNNDLAIINLPKDMVFGDFVGAIPIECNDKNRHENEMVFISGWGKFSDSESAQTTKLRSAKVFTAPENKCKEVFGQNIIPSMLCVDARNAVGTCQGDSGGPVVSSVDGKLLGATSFGAVGCVQSAPRIFTRLSSFVDWIRAHAIDRIC